VIVPPVIDHANVAPAQEALLTDAVELALENIVGATVMVASGSGWMTTFRVNECAPFVQPLVVTRTEYAPATLARYV
jgi:hypothetical protein